MNRCEEGVGKTKKYCLNILCGLFVPFKVVGVESTFEVSEVIREF